MLAGRAYIENLERKMSEVLSLTALTREELGTGVSRALRRSGMVPATIYGGGNCALSIAIEEKELTKYYRRPQYMSQSNPIRNWWQKT